MRAGRLDRVITIQTASNTVDEAGVPVFAYAELATLRAEVIQSSTREFLEAQGARDDRVVIFRTRFVDGVTPEASVLYAGTRHNIREVKEIGRRKGLEIRTEAT